MALRSRQELLKRLGVKKKKVRSHKHKIKQVE